MGHDSHAWEDRCRDEAPVTPMGTLETITARSARAPQPCQGISARGRKLSVLAPLTRHGAPVTPMPGMLASLPQTCHDNPWPCHDTMPQQVLGHQPSQAGAAGQQTKECHDTRWPPQQHH
ncbi:hypothetical protein CJ030_MR7G009283 [Morella rubra]|uniref:Uncharacterized protein n=1 Tax=Morella rubra TaxID=262757 RepID=A0A6A1V047_9ROSI|nr:hypothetical protein CJ030_MR7G009283 [Morella rubra]